MSLNSRSVGQGNDQDLRKSYIIKVTTQLCCTILKSTQNASRITYLKERDWVSAESLCVADLLP